MHRQTEYTFTFLNNFLKYSVEIPGIYDVTCWGRTSEIAAQYLSKGRPVFIEDRLQMDTWEDKQTGQCRSRIRIIAENLQLLGGRDGAQQGGGGYNNNGGGYQQRNNYGINGTVFRMASGRIAMA